MTRFEFELRKRIDLEIERLRDDLENGGAIKDHAQYQNYVGRLQSLKRVLDEFIDEVNTVLNKE